jgi:hypothetical protein
MRMRLPLSLALAFAISPQSYESIDSDTVTNFIISIKSLSHLMNSSVPARCIAELASRSHSSGAAIAALRGRHQALE